MNKLKHNSKNDENNIIKPTYNLEKIPPVLGNFYNELAKTGWDRRGYYLTSTLMIVSTMIGNRAVLYDTDDTNSNITNHMIWGCLYGTSGTGKTSSFNNVSTEFNNSKLLQLQKNKNKIDDYNRKLQEYLKEKKEFDKNPRFVCPPIEPIKPYLPKMEYNQLTIEKAIQNLESNAPHGIFLNVDEIFDFYKGLKPQDSQAYLKSFTGESYVKETKGNGEDSVKSMRISLFGGIQPERLNIILEKYDYSGFLERFQLIPIEIDDNKKMSNELYIKNPDICSNYNNVIKNIFKTPDRFVFDSKKNERIEYNPVKYCFSKSSYANYTNWYNDTFLVIKDDVEKGNYDGVAKNGICRFSNTFKSVSLYIQMILDNGYVNNNKNNFNYISDDAINYTRYIIDYYISCFLYVYKATSVYDINTEFKWIKNNLSKVTCRDGITITTGKFWNARFNRKPKQIAENVIQDLLDSNMIELKGKGFVLVVE